MARKNTPATAGRPGTSGSSPELEPSLGMRADAGEVAGDPRGENERLRQVVIAQKDEIRELTRRFVNVEVPRLKERLQIVEEHNAQLVANLSRLKAQLADVERENRRCSERYMEVEEQSHSLLNHYVASQRLHSTRSFDEVTQVIKEIVINLVGSEAFEVCLLQSDRARLVPVAAEGPHDRRGEGVRVEGLAAAAVESGMTTVAEDRNSRASSTPIACVPLAVGSTIVGAILIHGLLPQKHGLDTRDHELFALLTENAGTAMLGAFALETVTGQTDGLDWQRLVERVLDNAGTTRRRGETTLS